MKTINLNVPKNLYSALESKAARSKKTIQELLNESIEHIYQLESAIELQDKFCLLVIKHFESSVKNYNLSVKVDSAMKKLIAGKASISYMSENELLAIISGLELEEIGQVGITPCFYAVGRGYYYLFVKELALLIEVDLESKELKKNGY